MTYRLASLSAWGLGTRIAPRLAVTSPSRSSPEARAMSQKEANLLWLKDMLDHLRACQQQLQWAEDAAPYRSSPNR